MVAEFLFVFLTVLLVAKIGGEVFERWKQPAVLGELVFGILIGNLGLLGLAFFGGLKTNENLALVAEIGVILLLFEVGLESDLDELLAVGKSAMLVATLGVIAPMGLGYFVSAWFLPGSEWYVHLFVGATLAATSVGITARVLKDLGKTNTGEARIILAAAVVDDVLGLIILAMVSGLVSSIGESGSADLEVMPLLVIIGKAVLFLLVSVVAGRPLAGWLLRTGSKAKSRGMSVALSVAYCFGMAGLAEVIGLAPIVGAFAAGLVLNEGHYRGYSKIYAHRFEEVVQPISLVFTPVFFVYIGMKVDLRSLTSLNVLLFAGALSLAAIAGKQLCSVGVVDKGVKRLAVGIGMIPRGEVGLIFASIGSSLMVAGQPVFSSDTFSALILMVMVTTLATPPLLKILLTSGESSEVLKSTAEPDASRQDSEEPETTGTAGRR